MYFQRRESALKKHTERRKMTADPAVRGKREHHRPVRLLSCLYVAVFM
jgi:hypothetical protein